MPTSKKLDKIDLSNKQFFKIVFDSLQGKKIKSFIKVLSKFYNLGTFTITNDGIIFDQHDGNVFCYLKLKKEIFTTYEINFEVLDFTCNLKIFSKYLTSDNDSNTTFYHEIPNNFINIDILNKDSSKRAFKMKLWNKEDEDTEHKRNIYDVMRNIPLPVTVDFFFNILFKQLKTYAEFSEKDAKHGIFKIENNIFTVSNSVKAGEDEISFEIKNEGIKIESSNNDAISSTYDLDYITSLNDLEANSHAIVEFGIDKPIRIIIDDALFTFVFVQAPLVADQEDDDESDTESDEELESEVTA